MEVWGWSEREQENALVYGKIGLSSIIMLLLLLMDVLMAM